MVITKGTRLKVKHSRKGVFTATAAQDFKTEDEWYPVVLDQENDLRGLNNTWVPGENVPCRASLCTVEVITEGKK